MIRTIKVTNSLLSIEILETLGVYNMKGIKNQMIYRNLIGERNQLLKFHIPRDEFHKDIF